MKMGGRAGKEGIFSGSAQCGNSLSSLNPIFRTHENFSEMRVIGEDFQGRMIDPHIIAPSDLPRGTLSFPFGESGENNPLCQGHDVHGSSCEIIQPILIPISNKNILSRVPLMPIPIEKAITLRFVPVPVFSAHIFYGVTL